jgi:hypothetical protein
LASVVVLGLVLLCRQHDCVAVEQQRSGRGPETDRVLVGVDLMVRNADIVSISGLVGVRLVGDRLSPSLALAIRLRAGLGGGTAGLGLLGYWPCVHVDLPCMELGVQAVALRTWGLSNWADDTYVGGELRAQYVIFCATIAVLEDASPREGRRIQGGIGVGW